MSEVSGGADSSGGWRTVTGLQSVYLAMRTMPAFDYNDEMRGCELYNNDRVLITSSYVQGYVWVYAEKNNMSGYVDSAFLR